MVVVTRIVLTVYARVRSRLGSDWFLVGGGKRRREKRKIEKKREKKREEKKSETFWENDHVKCLLCERVWENPSITAEAARAHVIFRRKLHAEAAAQVVAQENGWLCANRITARGGDLIPSDVKFQVCALRPPLTLSHSFSRPPLCAFANWI